MTSVQTPPSTEIVESRDWRAAGPQVLRSRVTFVVLQVFDLATTLMAFHMGGLELNPLVANLTRQFGGLRGVLIGKLVCIAIAMGIRQRIWIVNLFYVGIVGWNLVVLLLLSHLRPH